jgi:ketosteroid isomerase-like protein
LIQNREMLIQTGRLSDETNQLTRRSIQKGDTMSATRIGTTDETAIRDLIENWAKAVRNKNMEGILYNHSSDILMFDVPPPIQSKGIEAYKQTWDFFYGWYQGNPAFDIREMNVTAGNDVAFVTALMFCAGKTVNGDTSELDFRLTVGLRKIGDRWIVEHEHHSLPAD